MKKQAMDKAFDKRKKAVEGSPEEEAAESPDQEKAEVQAATEVPESPNKNVKVPNKGNLKDMARDKAMTKRREKLK